MLWASLRRWALVVVASLLVGWAVSWALGRLIGGLDDQWLWLWLPISVTSGGLGALWVRARQIERANLPMVGRARPR